MVQWLAVAIAVYALYRSKSASIPAPRPAPRISSGIRIPTPGIGGTVLSAAGPIATTQAGATAQGFNLGGQMHSADNVDPLTYVALSKSIYRRDMAIYTQIRSEFEV
jgi:hypothetical protein